MDIRHTLPNLKYLLLFVSSNTSSGSGGGGEVMPERTRPSSPFVKLLSRKSSEIGSPSAAIPTANDTNTSPSSATPAIPATPAAASVPAVDKGKKVLSVSGLIDEAVSGLTDEAEVNEDGGK